MEYKVHPKDFKVDEIYDLEELSKKDEEKGEIYTYFILEKKEYTTLRAIERIAKTFHTKPRNIAFAGTKDKVGITTQIISIKNTNKKELNNTLEYFNEQADLKLTPLGSFTGRINLGDNKGNRFTIVTRNCTSQDLKVFEDNSKNIVSKGVYNYFDEQRFGYAQNSHIVGKYLLQGDFQKAFWEIVLSIPKTPNENLKIWNDFLKENITKFENQDESLKEKMDEIAPKFLRAEVNMLKWIIKNKNDFAGAMRLLPKKMRTLYVHAYQSYVFNELCVLMKKEEIEQQNELELVHVDLDKELPYYNNINEIIKKDDLTIENFKLQRTPELKLKQTLRETKIFPKEFQIIEIKEEFPNNFVISFSFSLPSGSYATNIIKQLFVK